MKKKKNELNIISRHLTLAVILTRGYFALQGHLSMSGRIFGCHKWQGRRGLRCCCHLVGRDQQGCQPTYNVQNSPYNKNLFGSTC